METRLLPAFLGPKANELDQGMVKAQTILTKMSRTDRASASKRSPTCTQVIAGTSLQCELQQGHTEHPLTHVTPRTIIYNQLTAYYMAL